MPPVHNLNYITLYSIVPANSSTSTFRSAKPRRAVANISLTGYCSGPQLGTSLNIYETHPTFTPSSSYRTSIRHIILQYSLFGKPNHELHITHSSATPLLSWVAKLLALIAQDAATADRQRNDYQVSIQKRQSPRFNLLPPTGNFPRIHVPDIHNSTLVSDFTFQPQEGVTRPAPFRRSPLRGNRVSETLLEGWISMLTSLMIASGSVARSLAWAACTRRSCSSLTGSFPVLSGCGSRIQFLYAFTISARLARLGGMPRSRALKNQPRDHIWEPDQPGRWVSWLWFRVTKPGWHVTDHWNRTVEPARLDGPGRSPRQL